MKHRKKSVGLLLHFIQPSAFFLAKSGAFAQLQSRRSEKGGSCENESGSAHLESGGGLLLLELSNGGVLPDNCAIVSGSRVLVLVIGSPGKSNEELIVDGEGTEGRTGGCSKRSGELGDGGGRYIGSSLHGTLG